MVSIREPDALSLHRSVAPVSVTSRCRLGALEAQQPPPPIRMSAHNNLLPQWVGPRPPLILASSQSTVRRAPPALIVMKIMMVDGVLIAPRLSQPSLSLIASLPQTIY